MDKGTMNRFSRIAVCTLACLAALGLGGCSLLTPTRAEVPPKTVRTKITTPVIANKGVLTVALDAADAPQAMNDADGRLVGYSVDVAYAIAERLGLKVEFVTDEGPDSVGKSDSADIYIGATSDDETDDVLVIGTYLENAPSIFARTEGAGEQGGSLSAADLSGAKIGVQISSAAQDVLVSSGVDAEFKTYGNVNECLEALGSGEVDYVACDATAGAYLARAHAGTSFAASLDTPSSIGIAIKAKRTELIDAIQGALDEISADGTLDAIHRAWYGDMPMSTAEFLLSGIQTSEERELAKREQAAAQEQAADSPEAEDAPAE
ncbi:MAG: transporter substrate-binding domain-containing protein [Collinsella sp.]|nr:transporter substrate-binding domain-containing protein [Collinsella sp.]